LEDLLHREQGKRGSTFAWLKEPAVKASPASIKTLITRLEMVRQLQMSSIDLSRLNRNRVRVLAHLGAKYHRDSLKTHHATHGKVLTRHIHTFRKVTKIVLDPEIPDEQVRRRMAPGD
jgi:hypothetical protein